MMSMMTAKDSPDALRRGAGGGGAARKADSHEENKVRPRESAYIRSNNSSDITTADGVRVS
jgi:hypothetical protein